MLVDLAVMVLWRLLLMVCGSTGREVHWRSVGMQSLVFLLLVRIRLVMLEIVGLV